MSPCETLLPLPDARPPVLAALGPEFGTRLAPQPLPDPYWVARSPRLARELGLPDDWLQRDSSLQALAGNAPLSAHAPLASVYSGHQFGVWAGQLGDGRAVQLAETASGQELQLKGSGHTPYSRRGDGRAVLRSSIREFLCSEAMHALGIPSTRALCVIGSDQPVWRETRETAAVLTRTAPSFIRFGHFEHFAHSGQHDSLRRLADHVIARHYPECLDHAQPALALLQAVIERTARLVAQWQAVGFCHGVLNTDNMSILGLTIDYGPFQFMDAHDPAHVCNASDHTGRYAFRNQPAIAHWNLAALAQALLPLVGDVAPLRSALDAFAPAFEQALALIFTNKLGFAQDSPAVTALARQWLDLLADARADHSLAWRTLGRHMSAQADASALLQQMFQSTSAFGPWLDDFERLAAAPDSGHSATRMLQSNPALVLRNHLAELAIEHAKLKDFGVLQELLQALERPFDAPATHPDWAGPPPDWARQIRISCSS